MTSDTEASGVPTPLTPRKLLLGVHVDALTIEEAVHHVGTMLDAPPAAVHASLNAAVVVQMRRNPALRDAIETADLVTADGMSVVWASRLLGAPLPARVTGIDL